MKTHKGRFWFVVARWELPINSFCFSFYGRYGFAFTLSNWFEFFLMWDFNKYNE